MNAKCDYCDQRATTLVGDTNGVLVCEDHVRLSAEREIAAAIDHAERYPGYEKHKRHMLTSPPAVAASTGTSEDVEALVEALTYDEPKPLDDQFHEGCREIARAVLASDWLAAHDAATAERVRRETAEEWVARLSDLCDDEWLRRRDRAMEAPGSKGHRWERRAASAWETAARSVRAILNDLADYEDEYVDRHAAYSRWMREGRDEGAARIAREQAR